MWCRTVRKLIYDHVDGMLDERMGGKVRQHLERCVRCAQVEEEARFLTSSLAEWEDVPPPEDGLHRLETRLAFLPALGPEPRPKGRLLKLGIPYFAGVASAAALLIALLPLFNPAPPPVGPEPEAESPVAMESDLLPGERELAYRDVNYIVDDEGNLLELPDDVRNVLIELLHRRSASNAPGRPGGLDGAVPVRFGPGVSGSNER
jgi:hypothetical protein